MRKYGWNKKKIVLFLFIILLKTSSCFSGEWTEEDTARELHFLYTIANDWNQTCDIIKTNGLYEKNKLLGKHPKRGLVNCYFIVTAISHVIIADSLNQPFRRYWQDTWIGIQSNQIQENDELDLKQNLKFGMNYRIRYTLNF